MLALVAAAALGSAHFTATGLPECQRKVLEGVLYLHSFMYEDARASFQEAAKSRPCPIAHWGEAMTYDHPIWNDHDAAAGSAALAKLDGSEKVSPVEKGLIEAARALYGRATPEEGRAAWMERLQRLHEELPKDDEVSLFYALSLYANSNLGKNVKRAMQAAAIAMDVFERNPNHPGAAHYLIHACDSPDHAILALKAAQRYAQIAPAAGHALHMPSHIFVQLGMWADAEKSNIAAFAASQADARRKGEPRSKADWHSHYWLAAARLELGKPDLVLKMIDDIKALDDPKMLAQLNLEKHMWLEATRSWNKLDELFGAPEEPDYTAHRHMWVVRSRLDAAAEQGDVESAEKYGKQLMSFHMPFNPSFADYAAVAAPAKIAMAKSVRDPGLTPQAVDALRKLADKEDDGAIGPALSIPARETLGELLLRTPRFVEGEREFRRALEVRPNRLNALRGLAEAARGADDLRTAEDAQAKLTAQVH